MVYKLGTIFFFHVKKLRSFLLLYPDPFLFGWQQNSAAASSGFCCLDSYFSSSEHAIYLSRYV